MGGLSSGVFKKGGSGISGSSFQKVLRKENEIKNKKDRENKNKDKDTEGSVTVFFALAFAVMVSLILTEITSAKVQAGRAQAANVMDLSMDSLFAHYDRESADLFGLYYLYTGHGGGPDPSGCIELIGECADELFEPSALRSAAYGKTLLKLRRQECALTSYSLITDASGTLFRQMAGEAARDTDAAELLQKLSERLSGTGSQNAAGSEYLEKSERVSYSDVREIAESTSSQVSGGTESGESSAESDGTGSADSSTESGGQGAEEVEVPDDFVNPLPVLESIEKGGILELVLPEGKSVSADPVDRASLVSGRTLATGIGTVDASGTPSDNLFRAWVFTHFGNFTKPSEHSVLSCQMEYILAGKSSDRENLKQVVRKLLLTREAVNIYCLYTDAQKSAELESLAAVIAAALLIPEATELIRLVLAAGWAYAESIVDVRALLEGKKIAAVKTASTWQTDAEGLAKSGGDLNGLTKDVPSGLSYEDFLGMLLLTANIRELTMRSMDMTECELRGRGRENFRLDSCMAAVTAEMTVTAESLVTFPVTREESYLENS